MSIKIYEQAGALYVVEWFGEDHFRHSRGPFLTFRDARRYAAQLECRLLIDQFLTAYDRKPIEEVRLH